MSDNKEEIHSSAFNISELAIKKPVSTIMMIFTLIVLGIISYGKLSVELFPNVSFPVVVITTNYPGASSQEIETLVTKPLEDAVSSINGLEHVRSTSGSGFSSVIIEFKLEKDMKDAANEVREKVSLIRPSLPEDVEEPLIMRVDPDAAPIINYVIGGNYPLHELNDFVKDKIKPQLEQIDGVAGINILGGQEREVLVTLNPSLVKKYGLTFSQIGDRIKQENLNFPSGSIKSGVTEIPLRTTSSFSTAEEIGNIPVKISSGKLVLLKNLGEVKDSFKEIKNKAWLNGKTALVLSVQKQSGTNTIKIVQDLNKKLEKIKPNFPKGINVGVSFDTSQFIIESKDAAIEELIVGAVLAIIVIYIFLRTVRGTIIAALAIPTSVISTYTLMYVMGFSINMMTLLGLSLVVGILVDDAVVDLENIYRRMQLGEKPYQAAINATNEIGLAVVATTFSIVAVFVPIGFMTGIVGQFFKQFGLTVSFSVLISLLVARTLTPTLSAYFLKPPKHTHDEDEVKGIAYNYKNILAWALKHRLATVVVTTVVFLISIPIAGLLPKGFVPKNDRDEFSIAVQTSPGSTIEQTSAILNEIAKRVREDKDIKETLVIAGNSRGKTNTGSVSVTARSKKEGRDSIFTVIDRLQAKIQTVPGASISFREMRLVDDGAGNYAMNLSLRGENLDELQKVADKVTQKLHEMTIVSDSTTSSGTPQSEIHIKVDYKKAASLGITASAIAGTLRVATFGDVPSKLHLSNKDVDIRLRIDDNNRYDIEKLKSISIPSMQGINVPLSSIARLEYTSGPTTIERYDRQRQIMVYANTRQGISMGEIVDLMEKYVASLKLPSTIQYSFKGDAERMIESFNSLLTALFIAIIFIYIILASQFEHFIHPFTIMMALPLSFVGAFLGMFIVNEELGMMSMIGVVMLMGLVTKNSILLVDYTLTMRKQGLSREEALLKAGPVRLRPILMTTVAMVVGMLPIAMRLTPGSEGRAPMAVAVIGGLITSTLLSLVVIPVFYTIMDDIIVWFVSKFKKSDNNDSAIISLEKVTEEAGV